MSQDTKNFQCLRQSVANVRGPGRRWIEASAREPGLNQDCPFVENAAVQDVRHDCADRTARQQRKIVGVLHDEAIAECSH